METVLAVIAGFVICGAAFALGWDAARSRNHKFEKTIQSSYERLLAEQKELRETDAGSAFNKGWNEGYREGREDTQTEIRNSIARYQ